MFTSTDFNISAVVSVREEDERVGRRTLHRDAVHLLRSYEHLDHHQAYDAELPVLGRDNATLIYEAARATSAAPFFFKPMEIRRYKYMDGGVGYNNPSTLAWNEVVQMTPDKNNQKIYPSIFLSIGTGRSKPQSRFGGLPGLINWARKFITETESTHRNMLSLTAAAGTTYHRMNVHSGLEKMSFGEWKKKRRPKTKGDQVQREVNGTTGPVVTNQENGQRGMGSSISADQPGVRRRLKEDKWEYKTLDTIRRCTDTYCSPRQDSLLIEIYGRPPKINECARQLFDISQARMAADPERWQNFIKNHSETARQDIED